MVSHVYEEEQTRRGPLFFPLYGGNGWQKRLLKL